MKILPLLLAGAIALGGSIVPNVDPQPDVGSVQLTAGAIRAGIVRPAESLQLTGSVTNSSQQVIEAAVAVAYLPKTRLKDADDLDSWLEDAASVSNENLGTPVATALLGDLGMGQIRSFGLSIPPRFLEGYGTGTVVLPVIVRVTSGEVTVASWKTAATLIGQTPTPASLSIVTPITVPPDKSGLLSAEQLELLTSPGGALYRQLEIASAHNLALGIDPMVLASIRILGDDAPETSSSWLEAMAALPNDSFALSYADANQGLALQAGAESELSPLGIQSPLEEADVSDDDSNAAAPSTSGSLGVLTAWSYSISGLNWPAPVSLRAEDAGALAKAGAQRLLLDDRQSKSTLIDTANVKFKDLDDLNASLVDHALSQLLDQASRANTMAEQNDALAKFGAYLAAKMESGVEQFIVALNRDDSGLGARVEEALGSVESIPLATLAPLSSVVAAPSYESAFVSKELDPKRVSAAKALLEAEAQVTSFSTVVDRPELLNWPRRLALLALFSQSWASSEAGWNTATGQFLEESSDILNSVHIPEGSTITLLQEKGNLPIAVANELSFPVTVYIRAKPDRAILNVLENRVELKIEANSQAKAAVPVQSIANGTVLTRLSLESGSGVQISDPTFVELNVQAGWETAATIVLAIVVVIIFGAGIWRTVNRRRRSRESEQVS
ncbi:MAG: hypothetical protein KF742_01920 [Cryobacterium sp.]|nr:hypothetical protein [Cryobacterium sp.]